MKASQRSISEDEHNQTKYRSEVPYELCDALFRETLLHSPALKATRRALTSGTCEYRIEGYGKVELRTTHENQTLIRIAPPPDMDTSLARVALMTLRDLLALFSENIKRDLYEHAQLPTIATLPQVEGLVRVFGSPPMQPKPRGRKRTPEEDTWAWEQVNVLKRPKDEVRIEWEKKLSRVLQDKKRSFAHAVNQNKGRNIK